MTDNLDGTYTYSYSLDLDGTVTMYVFLYTQFGVHAEFFDNTASTGTVVSQSYPRFIGRDHGTGLITPTRANSASIKFFTKIKIPTSDTYTFYVRCDDGAIIWLDGVLKATCNHGTVSFSEVVDQNSFHDIVMTWYEGSGGAKYYLEWSYTGVGQTQLPSVNSYYPQYVASVQNQLTVSCPFGYSGSIASSPTKCFEI